MKSAVLSTTEAEYVAVSEVVKEIKFLYQMLRSMEIKVPLPIKVQVDNVSAIWLANNSSLDTGTKLHLSHQKIQLARLSDHRNMKYAV